jgi:hypothetical protein
MVIERIIAGVLTDEDAELYAAAREVMTGAPLFAVADAYGIAAADIEVLVEELTELEREYARMALHTISDLRKNHD